MHTAIPLERISTTHKLRAIEAIWADLAPESKTPESGSLPSPSWHADTLRDREQRIADGASRFLDIAQAKQAVRGQLE